MYGLQVASVNRSPCRLKTSRPLAAASPPLVDSQVFATHLFGQCWVEVEHKGVCLCAEFGDNEGKRCAVRREMKASSREPIELRYMARRCTCSVAFAISIDGVV